MKRRASYVNRSAGWHAGPRPAGWARPRTWTSKGEIMRFPSWNVKTIKFIIQKLCNEVSLVTKDHSFQDSKQDFTLFQTFNVLTLQGSHDV